MGCIMRANCYLIQCQPGPTHETARHAGAKPFARLAFWAARRREALTAWRTLHEGCPN